MAIVFCDRCKFETIANDVKMIKLADFPVHLNNFIVFHKKRTLSPKAGDFLDLLRKQR